MLIPFKINFCTVRKNNSTSFSDGSVDSRIDEKRSKLRYLPRIADALSGEILNAQRRWDYSLRHVWFRVAYLLSKCNLWFVGWLHVNVPILVQNYSNVWLGVSNHTVNWFSNHLRLILRAFARSNVARWWSWFSALFTQPELSRDYPPNLSISFSGGKETN